MTDAEMRQRLAAIVTANVAVLQYAPGPEAQLPGDARRPVAGRQQLTHEWWTHRRPTFEVCISELVVAEAAVGDPDAAQRRAQLVRDLPSLSISEEAIALARKLVQAARLPARAEVDALHISVAACHGIDYLLTWNSTHIASV